MKTFIFITGPMGVGKTAVGTALCDALGRAAFIDGDWCLDIHPFVGNRETKAMAVENILHMARNYRDCSECDTVVLSWVMSENTVREISAGASALGLRVCSVTLTCGEEALTERWKQDEITPWRTDEELAASLRSLPGYSRRTGTHLIDTSELSVAAVAEKIRQLVEILE